MLDVLQIIGALGVLIPFVWSQVGSMPTGSWVYLWLNVVGSGLLAALALIGSDWGFLLLEGVWALVAGWSLLRRARGRMSTAAD